MLLYKLLLIALLIVGCLFGREFDLEIQQTINFRTQDIYQNINVFDENKFRVEVEIEIADTIYNQEYEDDYVKYLETEKYIGYFAEPIKNSPVILMIRFQFNVLINKQYVTLEETEKVKLKLKHFIQNNGWGWNTENVWFSYVDFESLEKKNDETEISTSLLLNRDDIYDDSWAVIIGIDKYKYSDQLNYAVKDAEAVKDMLISKFDYPEKNIRYLVDEEATLSNIKLNLGEVATSANENDRILVFYSGHGETLIGADKSEKGYIIPVDGKQDNPYATGIAMDEILTTSQISKSKHMLFLMDACYSGLMTEHVKGLIPQKEGYLNKVANEKARQIITAGGNEPAIEGGRWNHSVFTKNLLTGLNDWEADTDSDGYITADELGTYLRKSVTEDSNNQQTPQKGRFINSGGGEFVFFSNHNAINQNIQDTSNDAKLDYLISEMEELKSQKSSGGDIVLGKDDDGTNNWFEKYSYEAHGFGFAAFEDAYTIYINESMNKDWQLLIGYADIGNNSFSRLVPLSEPYSATAKKMLVSLSYVYYISNNILASIGLGGNYSLIDWKDIEKNSSGNFNIIIPSVSGGISLFPYQFDMLYFDMNIGISLGIGVTTFPSSITFKDGKEILQDWGIIVLPAFSLNFLIPK